VFLRILVKKIANRGKKLGSLGKNNFKLRRKIKWKNLKFGAKNLSWGLEIKFFNKYLHVLILFEDKITHFYVYLMTFLSALPTANVIPGFLKHNMKSFVRIFEKSVNFLIKTK